MSAGVAASDVHPAVDGIHVRCHTGSGVVYETLLVGCLMSNDLEARICVIYFTLPFPLLPSSAVQSETEEGILHALQGFALKAFMRRGLRRPLILCCIKMCEMRIIGKMSLTVIVTSPTLGYEHKPEFYSFSFSKRQLPPAATEETINREKKNSECVCVLMWDVLLKVSVYCVLKWSLLDLHRATEHC